MPDWRKIQTTVSVTKALVAASPYLARDVLSESISGGESWIFNDVVVGNGQSGYIIKAHVISETPFINPQLALFIFTSDPFSQLNDNLQNTALLHTDLAKYISKIDFPPMEDLGGDSEALATPSTSGNLPLAFSCAPADNRLYAILVTRDAFTQVSGDDMTVRLTVVRD